MALLALKQYNEQDEHNYYAADNSKCKKNTTEFDEMKTVDAGEIANIHCCQTCGKRFDDSCTLWRHQAVHSNERPYECTIYSKDHKFGCGFNRHNLDGHNIKKSRSKITNRLMFNLTDWTQFCCPICRVDFKLLDSLRKHVKHEHKLGLTVVRKERFPPSNNKNVYKFILPQDKNVSMQNNTKISQPTAFSTAQKLSVFMCKLCCSIVEKEERGQHVQSEHWVENEPFTLNSEAWYACFGGVSESFLHAKSNHTMCQSFSEVCAQSTFPVHANGNCRFDLGTQDEWNLCTIQKLGVSKRFICKLCASGFQTKFIFVQHLRSMHRASTKTFCGSEIAENNLVEDKTTLEVLSSSEKQIEQFSEVGAHSTFPVHANGNCRFDSGTQDEWNLCTIQKLGVSKRFICKLCGSGFRTKFIFVQHLRSMHRTSTETFSGSETAGNNLVEDKTILEDSSNSEKQIEQSLDFCCDLCQRSFTSMKYLNQHRRMTHEIEIKQTVPLFFPKRKQSTRKEKDQSCNSAELRKTLVSTSNDIEPKIFKLGIMKCNMQILNNDGCEKHVNNLHKACFESSSHEIESTSKNNQLGSNVEPVRRCEICSLDFKSSTGLKMHHTKIHFQKRNATSHHVRTHSCKDCELSFCSLVELHVHRRQVHRNSYKCPVCLKRFLFKFGFLGHFRAHRKEGNIGANPADSCSTNESFRNLAEVNNEIEEEITSNMFQDVTTTTNKVSTVVADQQRWLITCDFCMKVCESQEFLKQHSLENHVGTFCAFRCDACEFISSNRRRMLEHCRAAHGSSKHLQLNLPNEDERSVLSEVCEKLLAKKIVLNIPFFL